MGNVLRVRRDAYVSYSFSKFMTPETVLLWMSQYLTSKGYSHTLTSEGIFHIKSSSDRDSISDDDNLPGSSVTSKSISAFFTKDIGKNSFLMDLISFEVSAIAKITEGSQKRELRFEPGKVKGLGIPMGALRIHEEREMKMGFRNSTVMIAGTHEDHILWGPTKSNFPKDLYSTEFNLDEAPSLVVVRAIDQLGSREEIKSVQPGVFIITWIQNQFIRSRLVGFERKKGTEDHGRFEIHPDSGKWSYDKLSFKGDAAAGKIDIRNVQDGKLKLMFPLPVTLSISVKPGGEVTLIRWRKNDMRSKDMFEAIDQTALPAMNTSGASSVTGNSSFNIIMHNVFKDLHVLENQNVKTNLYGGASPSTYVGSLITRTLGEAQGDDDGGKKKVGLIAKSRRLPN